MSQENIRSYNSSPQVERRLEWLARAENTSKSEIVRKSIEAEFVRKSKESKK